MLIESEFGDRDRLVFKCGVSEERCSFMDGSDWQVPPDSELSSDSGLASSSDSGLALSSGSGLAFSLDSGLVSESERDSDPELALDAELLSESETFGLELAEASDVDDIMLSSEPAGVD
jgi:hypothetical protein